MASRIIEITEKCLNNGMVYTSNYRCENYYKTVSVRITKKVQCY